MSKGCKQRLPPGEAWELVQKSSLGQGCIGKQGCARPATRTSLHMCTKFASVATLLHIVLAGMGSHRRCAAQVSHQAPAVGSDSKKVHGMAVLCCHAGPD